MPTQETIFDLYVRLLAARNRRMETQAAHADAYRRNIYGAEFERISAEYLAALSAYHELGIEWLQLIGLKPFSTGGGPGLDGRIAGYHAPCFEETSPTP